ncbi:phage tail protein [Pseudomonas sp. TMB3-21]
MSSGVKKLAQVVVGAVVGFAQGGPWGAVIGAGLAFYAAEQQEKLNTKSPLRDNEPSAQTVRSSKAPVRFILGRVATGGVLVWAQEQAGFQGEGEWLHMVYVLSEGPIDALENIYLGEEEIGSFGAFASYELIVNPTQVNAFLLANCAGWKDSQIGRGLSFVRLSLRYSAEKYPSGIPDVRFVVRGRNDIYDPRSGTVGYSSNTALHMLWFLRARCGVPDDEIIFPTFVSAANVCDEGVTNADGSVSQRYRSSCVIGADEQRTGVLQKLEAACAGKLIRVGGKWMLQAGAYYGPYDFEITEDMVIGTITGSTEPTNDAAINTVRGTFIDPSQSWTETDYPEVRVDEWVVEDGGEAAETLTFSYVTDPYQAQRLANIELRRRRGGGTINIPMNLSGYNCRPGRVIRVNLPSLNILGEFIVTNWSMGNKDGCSVSVAQYEPAIFSDAVGQPYNPIGFINLPAGGLGSPTNLTWTQQATAEVIQGVLSWLPPAGIVKEYIVTVRQGVNVTQSHNVPATSTECAINGLLSGNYTMSVAAAGPLARSGEAAISVSINGPPIPESCVVQSSIDNIVLIPQNPNYGLNGGTYEYFFSTSPTATAADADYLGQGLSFTHTGLAFYTNYYYFVRSSNAYGKSAFLYVPASTSNDISAYLAAMAGKIGETELGKDLLDRIDLIDGSGPGSVNERLQDLQDEIGDLVDALVYVPTDPYVRDNTVRAGDNLWTAIADVPANADGSNGPPNATYWVNSGQSIRTANGLAAQVTQNTANITTVDGKTTANAQQISGLQTELTGKASVDALNSLTGTVTDQGDTITAQGSAITGITSRLGSAETGIAAQAQAITDLDTEVTTIDGKVNAQATKIDGVFAQVNPALAGDTAGYAGSDQMFVGVWSEQSARIEDGVATGKRIDVVQVSVNGVSSAVQTESLARASADSAMASQIATVQAVANGASAAVQTVSQAQASTDGKLSTMWSVKMQVNAQGQYVAAGIGLGIENTAAGLQSQFLVSADRFAIVNGINGNLSVPFAVQNGQAFLQSAFILDGTITNAKIGSYISSTNYIAGQQGWILNKDGTLEINGVVPGQGRLIINSQNVSVYDANNVLRVRLGYLG